MFTCLAIGFFVAVLEETYAVSPYTAENHPYRVPLTHQASIRSVSCPPSCYCSSTTWNCDNGGLTLAPEGIPSTILYLSFRNNDIQSIPPDFLRDLPLLRTFDMRDNRIESINYAAFSDLPQLETIYLANNKIKSIQLESFTNLDQLRTLRLDNNSITRLEAGTFQDLLRVKEIRLDNNPIHRIVPGAFRRLPRLERIQMDNSLTNFTHLGEYDYDKALGERTFAPECPMLNQIMLGQMEIRALQPGSMGIAMNLDNILTRIRRVGLFQVYSTDLEECDVLSKFSITDKSYGVTMCLPKQDAQGTDSPSRQEKAHLGNNNGRLLESADEGANTDVGEKIEGDEQESNVNGNSKSGDGSNFGNSDLHRMINSLSAHDVRRLEKELIYGA